VDWFVDRGDVEWLPRATHLAINLGFVWLSSPGGTLVDGHPGTKRLPRLPFLVSFQCSLMTIWALS
jgi:hypothetical protein